MDAQLLVTVESASGRHVLRVPQSARVEDVLPGIVQVCEGRADGVRWKLKPLGEDVLAADTRLSDSGLFPGAVLQLIEPEPMPPSPHPTHVKERVVGRDYLGSLDGAIAARDISRSMVVAVAAAHPGAGTTTVAALLATLLGRVRQDSVVVADANPESGALSHWLAPDASRPDFSTDLGPQPVLTALVGLGDRTSVLPAAAGEVDWAELIEHLRRLQKIVVLDCAAGFRRPSSSAAIGAADLVVLVTKSPARAPELPLRKTVVVVENQASRRSRSPRASGRPHVVTLVDEPAAADRLKTRGFSWNNAPESWQESIRELAAVLIGSAS
ncbi:MAG: hypothetical protein E6I73_09310 [Chloroflexi bacterium]|nr:MAG: hypothetical protein E6I73_09310 [Chloroflexota bacterium]